MTKIDRKPRVVIYGLGQYGLAIARFAVQREWPIVAAYNRAGPKVGQDLGRLAGLDRDIGVTIEDAGAADYGDLDADVGLVTVTNFLRTNLPAYEHLLGAGLNVLCHGVEAYFPFGSDPELAAKIDELAKRNGVTFSGSGIWDMSRIWAGILAAGPCTELRSLYHSSITDATRGGKEIMLQTGVGQTVDEFNEAARGSNAAKAYKTIGEHVLFGLGYTPTETEAHIEPVVTETEFDCPMLGRPVPAGDCIGTRSVAVTETEEGVQSTSQVEVRLFDEGEVEHMYWSVDGKPVSRVRTERDDSVHASAASLFNRVPDVIAARPGVVTISEMGPLKPSVRS